MTPESRVQVDRILRLVRRGRRFLLLTHENSDADGLGSALGFARVLQRMGKQARVGAAGGVPEDYAFMAGASGVTAEPRRIRGPFDAVFTFDCGSLGRLGPMRTAVPEGVPIVNVDHHVSNERFGTINWVDPSFAATTEMVYLLAKRSGIRIDRRIASSLYTGLVTDTGGFSFSNTTPESHRMAAELIEAGARPEVISTNLFRQKTPGHLKLMARVIERLRRSADGRIAWTAITRKMIRECGVDPKETQEYVAVARSLKGVDVAVLFREVDGGSKIRVSFRLSGKVNGARLAARFGGGGHRRASGATVEGPLPAAERRVIGEIRRVLKGDRQ